jgi:hypothetical protein
MKEAKCPTRLDVTRRVGVEDRSGPLRTRCAAGQVFGDLSTGDPQQVAAGRRPKPELGSLAR